MKSRKVTTEQWSEFKVEITGTINPIIPAVLYGDNMHPEEGGDVEDIQVLLVRKDQNGKRIELDITNFIEQKELEYFEECLIDEVKDTNDYEESY
jgi:hypothetical protein